MVTSQQGISNGPGKVQDVEVPVLPVSGADGSKKQDRIRSLNVRAFLLHYRHIKSGTRRWIKGCPVCGKGLGALIEEAPGEAAVQNDGVVQGAGVDEKEAASPAPNPWWYR